MFMEMEVALFRMYAGGLEQTRFYRALAVE